MENSFFKGILGQKKSSQEQRLETIRNELSNVTDSLGKGIDPKIKETVAVFMASGLSTDSSCGGHTNEPNDKGYGFPYVRIYTQPPKGWETDKKNIELGEQWRQENLKQRAKLEPLLNSFNSTRNPTLDSRLCIKPVGIFGAFKIESIGVENSAQIKSTEEAVYKIKSYQAEMAMFTEYLRKDYLNRKEK